MRKKNERRKPRLLIILNRLVVGGQSIDTVPLAEKLSSDFDILILYGEKEKDEEEYTDLLNGCSNLRFLKLPTLKRSINPVNDIRSILRIWKVIREFEPDIVHTHGSKPGVAGRIAARMSKTNCIIHTFHGHVFHSYYPALVSGFIQSLERFLASKTDFIIALGAEQLAELSDKYKIATSDKIIEIPLGVDEYVYNQDSTLKREEARNRYQLQEDQVAIAIIGRMVPVKNHVFFLKAITAIIPQAAGKVKFFLVGDGELKHKLQMELRRHDISFGNANNNSAPVIFTSWVMPVTEILHAMDVVVVTSLNEGTPLSLIEAQLCGKPVVAIDAGGVKDTFLNNESGFLLPDYQVEPFVQKLLLLIGDKALREKMGNAGCQFAREKYNKEKEVEAMRRLYDKCL